MSHTFPYTSVLAGHILFCCFEGNCAQGIFFFCLPCAQWARTLFITKFCENEIFVVLALEYIQFQSFGIFFSKNRINHGFRSYILNAFIYRCDALLAKSFENTYVYRCILSHKFANIYCKLASLPSIVIILVIRNRNI